MKYFWHCTDRMKVVTAQRRHVLLVYAEFNPNLSKEIMGTAGRNLCTPLSKIWLSRTFMVPCIIIQFLLKMTIKMQLC